MTNYEKFTPLDLPPRAEKDTNDCRSRGINMVIDNGLPYDYFADEIASNGQFVDLVKFGWGTSYVNQELMQRKASCLRDFNIPFCFGGTLFERFVAEGKFKDYIAYCKKFGARYVEVSDGTIRMTAEDKKKYIGELAISGFKVFSEVGYKSPLNQDKLSHAKQWVKLVEDDLASGAEKVILEARESGRLGIATPEGELRQDVIDALLDANIDFNLLILEAPTRDLQVPLIQQLGPDVNFGNISPNDIVSLETLRLGLRSDTMIHALETLKAN